MWQRAAVKFNQMPGMELQMPDIESRLTSSICHRGLETFP